jgi:hypothetical protein
VQFDVVGDETASRMLSADEIRRLAPGFLKTLGSIIGVRGIRAIDIISRKGRILTPAQVEALLAWLHEQSER